MRRLIFPIIITLLGFGSCSKGGETVPTFPGAIHVDMYSIDIVANEDPTEATVTERLPLHLDRNSTEDEGFVVEVFIRRQGETDLRRISNWYELADDGISWKSEYIIGPDYNSSGLYLRIYQWDPVIITGPCDVYIVYYFRK